MTDLDGQLKVGFATLLRRIENEIQNLVYSVQII